MPIASGEIQFRLTHVSNASSSDPKLSLGGIRTTTQISSNVAQNLFDNVSGTQSRDGSTEYRCILVFNDNDTITLENARIWFSGTGGTLSTDDEVDMAIDPIATGLDTTTLVIANEGTAPVHNSTPLTFYHYTAGDELTIGDIPPNNQRGIWFRRTVQPNAAAFSNNTFSWTVEGESQ